MEVANLAEMLLTKTKILFLAVVSTCFYSETASLLADITTTFTSVRTRRDRTRSGSTSRKSPTRRHHGTLLQLARRNNNKRQKNDKSSKRKKPNSNTDDSHRHKKSGSGNSDNSVGRSTTEKGAQSSKKKLPRLIVFDLDGCLWKPELFEILTCPRSHALMHQYAECGVDTGAAESIVKKSSKYNWEVNFV